MADYEISASFRQLAGSHGYEVLELIDRGGFGDIFTVRRTASPSSRLLALKRLSSRRHVTEDRVILDEIRAMLALRHRHVIRLRDVILGDHVACIVMDLASLGNLETLLKGGRTPGGKSSLGPGSGAGREGVDHHHQLGEEFASRVFSQLLSALVYCHSRNVAHRDLQPANVLLVTWRRAVLADLGLATPLWDPLGNPVTCRDSLGRDPYLAPEVRRPRAPYRPGPSDVWSLGCLLVFLATRDHPDPTVLDSRADQTGRNPAVWSDFPSGGQSCCGHSCSGQSSSGQHSSDQQSSGQHSSGQSSSGHHSSEQLPNDQSSSDQSFSGQPSCAQPSSGQPPSGHPSSSQDPCGQPPLSEFPSDRVRCGQLTCDPLPCCEFTNPKLPHAGFPSSGLPSNQSDKPVCGRAESSRDQFCGGSFLDGSDSAAAVLADGCPKPDSGQSAPLQGRDVSTAWPRPTQAVCDTVDVKCCSALDDNDANNNYSNECDSSDEGCDDTSEDRDGDDEELQGEGTGARGSGIGGKETAKRGADTSRAVPDPRDSGTETAPVPTLAHYSQLSPSCLPPSCCPSCPACLSPSFLQLCWRMVDALCRECPDDRPDAESAAEMWALALASLRHHA